MEFARAKNGLCARRDRRQALPGGGGLSHAERGVQPHRPKAITASAMARSARPPAGGAPGARAAAEVVRRLQPGAPTQRLEVSFTRGVPTGITKPLILSGFTGATTGSESVAPAPGIQRTRASSTNPSRRNTRRRTARCSAIVVTATTEGSKQLGNRVLRTPTSSRPEGRNTR